MAAEIEILADAEAVAERGAEIVVAQADAAVEARGEFSFAVSGGHTPWAMLALLGDRLPWDRVAVFQVDERVAPLGSPDRNLTRLLESLPPAGRARVNGMPVDAADLETAATAYASTLPERLDLVHLGLGADGHTASLVPDDPVLEVADQNVATTGEYRGRRRMTLTYPAIDRARMVLWLVTGEDKADALERLRSGDRSIPAARIEAPRSLILADRAAAGDRAP